MYCELIKAMKSKKITYAEVAELLDCQLNTISDKVNGITAYGFSIDEAVLIKKIYFPEYDVESLFKNI